VKKTQQSAPSAADTQSNVIRSADSFQQRSLKQPNQTDAGIGGAGETLSAPSVKKENLVQPSTSRLPSPRQQAKPDVSIAETMAIVAEPLTGNSRIDLEPEVTNVSESGGLDRDATGTREPETADADRLARARHSRVQSGSSSESANQSARANIAGAPVELAEESRIEAGRVSSAAPTAASSVVRRQQKFAASVASSGIAAELQIDDKAITAETNARREAIILVRSSAHDWLYEQSKFLYTLQLATANDEDYLAEFAQNIARGSPRQLQLVVLALPGTNASNTQRYTLLAGVYSTFDEAKNALAQLPNSARQFGARVRNFGVLQKMGK